jgi:hypothetical protein
MTLIWKLKADLDDSKRILNQLEKESLNSSASDWTCLEFQLHLYILDSFVRDVTEIRKIIKSQEEELETACSKAMKMSIKRVDLDLSEFL